MKIIVGIATMNSRKAQLVNAIRSLNEQTIKPDAIHIYNNDEEQHDFTDNAKFHALAKYNEPVYYFSCDDDIFYPNWYIQETIDKIEQYNCIVTYHGRRLLGKGLNYYRGHYGYRCLGDVEDDTLIDVAGTGVTAFRTDYFNPTEIYRSEHKRMSDCVFSLEAAKQNKKIIVLSHKKGDFIDLQADLETSCYGREFRKPVTQGKIADAIYKLNYERD